MRSRFDQQLAVLNNELISMGALCESAIAITVKALSEADTESARNVEEIEEHINRKEREIESLCLKLLLQQQPVAGDLRLISAALKMTTDMERIGDQAADISEIVAMGHIKPTDESLYIGDMARATIKMVTDSIDAFVKKDIGIANSVIAYDDVVDEYFKKVQTSLTSLFGKSEEEGQHALDLLMVAKYFERIGDHAVNIAEWVVFSITGAHRKDGTLFKEETV